MDFLGALHWLKSMTQVDGIFSFTTNSKQLIDTTFMTL
jgi:hypothetical protein